MKSRSPKPQLTLVPLEAIEAIAEGLEDGHKRCGHQPNDWRDATDDQIWCDAAVRHTLQALLQGEWYDQESGIPHLAKAMSNMAIILTLRGYKYGKPHGYDIPTGDQQSTGPMGLVSGTTHGSDSPGGL